MNTSSLSSPPPRWRRLLEYGWPLEVVMYSLVPQPSLLVGVGDGHPVLALPGFTAGDVSTASVRAAVCAHGYRPYAWRLGPNVGPTARIVAGMRRRLEEISGHDDRKVTLIGASLGGIYARLLARERPELVRQVITLGSPYRMVDGDRSGASWLWERTRPLHDGDLPLYGLAEDERAPLSVPASSIYTVDDGIVHWQHCVDPCGPQARNPRAENIAVHGSHCALGQNPAALFAILDRLAQPENDWRPFRAPAVLRAFFPTAAADPVGRCPSG